MRFVLDCYENLVKVLYFQPNLYLFEDFLADAICCLWLTSHPSSKPTVIHEPVTTDFNHVRAQNIYQKFHKFRLMVSGAFFGPGVASCCTILSVIGVIFLVSIGIAFENNAHVLMGSTESPENGKKVARVCFASAIVYACLVGFCSCQLSANRRIARGGEVHLR